MSKGSEPFSCEFVLGQNITLDIQAVARAGRVETVLALFNGERFDCNGIMLDHGDDFIPMEETLKIYAQECYNDGLEDVIEVSLE